MLTTPEPDARSKAAQHVDLLGVLFLVWGGITILIGASTLALGVAAAALMVSSGRAGGNSFAAGLTALTFTVLAVMALIWGAAHVVVGRSLRRVRHWSRLVALSFATVDLLLLPYGTALGAYALWVLLREDAKPLFELRTGNWKRFNTEHAESKNPASEVRIKSEIRNEK